MCLFKRQPVAWHARVEFHKSGDIYQRTWVDIQQIFNFYHLHFKNAVVSLKPRYNAPKQISWGLQGWIDTHSHSAVHKYIFFMIKVWYVLLNYFAMLNSFIWSFDYHGSFRWPHNVVIGLKYERNVGIYLSKPLFCHNLKLSKCAQSSVSSRLTRVVGVH